MYIVNNPTTGETHCFLVLRGDLEGPEEDSVGGDSTRLLDFFVGTNSSLDSDKSSVDVTTFFFLFLGLGADTVAAGSAEADAEPSAAGGGEVESDVGLGDLAGFDLLTPDLRETLALGVFSPLEVAVFLRDEAAELEAAAVSSLALSSLSSVSETSVVSGSMASEARETHLELTADTPEMKA